MNALRGKKAIVTGGAMGLGFATCKRLLLEGCDITIWDMNEAAREEAGDDLVLIGKHFSSALLGAIHITTRIYA